MIEALWSIDFESEDGAQGGSIVAFRNGKLVGGDRRYVYTGSYSVDDATVTLTIDAEHYDGPPYPIFGAAGSPRIAAKGPIGERSIELAGERCDERGKTLTIRLVRRADLP